MRTTGVPTDSVPSPQSGGPLDAASNDAASSDAGWRAPTDVRGQTRGQPSAGLDPATVRSRKSGGTVFDWVIVGGGPHGVCAAQALASRGATLRIVEPSGDLLSRFRSRAKSVDMTWMRSPVSHHLDSPPVSLHHFLHRPEHADVAELAGLFRRPTYAAFLRHSEHLVDRHQFHESVVPGTVHSVRQDGPQLLIQGDGVELRARRILVATGSNAPRIPEWARSLMSDGAPIRHVFGADAPIENDLIGGGISAVQRALMIYRATGKPVRIWSRRPVQVADFDFDRAWAKHRFQSSWTEKTEADRLDFLARNGRRGSVPSGLAERLRRAVRRGSIHAEAGVPDVRWDPAGGRVVLRGENRTVESSGVTLVTGFGHERIAGWLRTTAEEFSLPRIQGLPRLDDQMHWGNGIYVSGPLARLRLGPMASHIVGARWAASKLPGVKMQPV